MAQANFVNGSAGTIAPFTFVTMDTSSSYPKAVNQATTATSFIIGIAQPYAATAPIPSASTAAATSPGDPVQVFQVGDVCFLSATTAGWSAGDRLTATTGGAGITASTTNYYGAIALTAMSGVGYGEVQVLVGKNP